MGFHSDLISFRACAWSVASATPDEVDAARLQAHSHYGGAAVVVSCQRIEAFHYDECSCSADAQWSGFDALSRMAEVAAGLHSVVLGEEQILGQVREGLEGSAPEIAGPGALAIAAARLLRQETAFGVHTGHLLDRAMQIAAIDPRGMSIAILGAGASARLVAERAIHIGFKSLTIVSRRRPDEAWFTASGAIHLPLESVSSLPPVDVLVCCLGSGAPAFGHDSLPVVRVLAIDLATPRKLPGDLPVPTLTIRSMLEDESRRKHSLERRAELRARLRTLLERRMAMSAENSETTVGRLRLEVERIRQEEAARTARLHPDLSSEAIDAITRSLLNRVFHRPTQRLRELGDPGLGAALADLFAAEAREGAKP